MKDSGKLKDEVDGLFKLPLAEFIEARNALAKRLKQNGRVDDANLVKTLVKPSVSAWAVNQLYWNHRVAFDRLLAAGQRFHKAQASGLSGKVADLRGSLDARREALLRLSELAETVLSDAGHSPSPDTIRRVTTTLEGISAHASVADGPTLGRLSQDVDPPGFDLLASFVSGVGTRKRTEAPARASQKSVPASSQPKAARQVDDKRLMDEKRQAEQARKDRQVRIAAAKLSVQAAKRSLVNARTRAQGFEAQQKKANAEVKEAEKRKRAVEEQLKHANAAYEQATQHARSVAEEATEAAEAVEAARRTVEKETKELESLFSELR
ncbi:MAG TPA: hypothetical protein VFY67_09670 [Pyrinomonadaceae bacterium]|nr:hypothetical protein [Pyrinomonadaceae bacterium]